jgi:hypothetical protein
MGRIYDAITTLFREDGWTNTAGERQPWARVFVKGTNGEYECVAKAREEQEQVLFYAYFPLHIPEEKRRDVAEFVARANYGLILGNLELDMRDREVRFKTSLDVEGMPVAGKPLKNLIYSNLLTMDRYLPGLMALLYGNVTAEQAVSQVEEPPPLRD